jgi:hypothetical protein
MAKYNRTVTKLQEKFPEEVIMTKRLEWVQQELDGLKEAGLYNRIRH